MKLKENFKMKRNIILLGLFFLCIYITYVIATDNPTNANDSDTANIISTSNDTSNVNVEISSINETEMNLNDKPVFKIVIDPGHGGEDPGAEGTSGQYEKDFSMQLAQKVIELAELETQIDIYLTRSEDRTISSIDSERTEFANQLGADLFISIHGNTYTDSSVFGTETYYYREESLPFTTIMHRNLVNATESRDRGVKKESFFVVRDTVMPAVILEVGYLTNPDEENNMWKDDYQYRVAASIIEGIKEYLEIS